MINKEELLKEYPFLKDEDGKIRFVDEIPEGWWKRFGIIFLDDLKDVLKRNKAMDSFRIEDVSVAGGCLSFVSEGYPDEWLEHLTAWEYISGRTCMECGAFPVVDRDIGSKILPLCHECLAKRLDTKGRKNYLNYLGLYIDEIDDLKLRKESSYRVEKHRVSDDKTADDKEISGFLLDDDYDYSSEYIYFDMIPYYKKIGYEYNEDHKDIVIIKEMPKEDYQSLCHDLSVSAEKLWDKYGEPMLDDLPVSEEKDRTLMIHRAYVRYAYEYIISKDGTVKEGYELLPPSQAFPDIGMMSIAWRMGTGEDYAYTYWNYYHALSMPEKIEHVRRYPRPFYQDDELMFDMTEMVDEEAKERVRYHFYNPLSKKDIAVETRYLMFYDLPEKEKNKEIERIRRGLAGRLSTNIIFDEKDKNQSRQQQSEEYLRLYKEIREALEFKGWEKIG